MRKNRREKIKIGVRGIGKKLRDPNPTVYHASASWAKTLAQSGPYI